MSVDFEGGRGKTVGACLHLVTLCVLSDQISIWFVTFGHMKNRYKSNLELGLPHYHVKEINSALHFIHHQPIKRPKIATGESGISSGKISYFTFGFIRGSLRVGSLRPGVKGGLGGALPPYDVLKPALQWSTQTRLLGLYCQELGYRKTTQTLKYV